MADDEKSPLLQSGDEDEGPRLRHHHTYPTLERSTDLSPVAPTEADHIVCVFVVTFDTRSGEAMLCIRSLFIPLPYRQGLVTIHCLL
mgnify:CR=1 FL=1